MRSIAAFVICVFASLNYFAQPGGYPFRVNVVDEKGEPIRDAWVKILPRQNGTQHFIERSFLPTDGSHSTFVAVIVGREEVEIDAEASAEGFDPATKTIRAKCCSPVETITLTANGKPRPEFPPLVTLRGRLMNAFGEPMMGIRFQGPSGYTYYPDGKPNGEYSIKVVPGSYRVEFWPSSCTRYTLEDYIVGPEGKTLDLTTECKYKRGNP